MKLSKCELGKIVKKTIQEERIGHIVGLTVQYPWQHVDYRGEVIVEVLWAGDKHPTTIHPNHIELYKD